MDNTTKTDSSLQLVASLRISNVIYIFLYNFFNIQDIFPQSPSSHNIQQTEVQI
jgi:hypothetical protein